MFEKLLMSAEKSRDSLLKQTNYNSFLTRGNSSKMDKWLKSNSDFKINI